MPKEEMGYAYLYNNPLFSDITLQLDDGVEISAHKVILAAGSMFFRKAFGGQFAESKASTLRLQDDEPVAAVVAMICYLYGHYVETTRINAEVVQEPMIFCAQVFAVADKYDVIQLREIVVYQFDIAIDLSWNANDFLTAVASVFRHGAIADKRMQSLALFAFESHMAELLTMKAFEEQLDSIPGLALQLLRYMSHI